MPTPILATKLYIPRLRPNVVSRPRLIERLNEGLHGRLTLISAPAGFGKTTLVSEWLTGCGRPAAWLSLDKGENAPACFLTYLISLVEHLPPQMHLVIITREDPPLPLARLRARGHLNELRASDLRFTPAEAAAFLIQVMGLTLSTADIAAL